MQKIAAADVVIVGGGIAGLWLLNRLRKAGFSAFLFESRSLGGGQTNKSQGIIHGGMKYALQGKLTKDKQALSTMPTLWKQCLNGSGEIDLSSVPILSTRHYLWSPHKFTSRLMGFLANATLTGDVAPLSRSHYPTIFQHPTFKGEVYSLDEIVIDVPLLIRELVKANQDAIFKIEPICGEELKFDGNGKLKTATISLSGKSVEISAQHFIFVAGAGNEIIINKFKQKDFAMQRRPLHMVLVKLPYHYSLYAHCLGLGSRPRITITTHRLQDGNLVWYLGGMLAETGIARDSAAQIQASREELHALFPWIDLKGAEFSTFMVERAELLQAKGFKPETSSMRVIENTIVAWPTKLALAPKLADDIMDHFKTVSLTSQFLDSRELRAWPIPPLAQPIWEEAFCCTNVA